MYHTHRFNLCQVDTVLDLVFKPLSGSYLLGLRTPSCVVAVTASQVPPKLTATFVPGWRSWRDDLCSNRSVVVPSFHRSPKFDGPPSSRHGTVIAITHSSCSGVV